jgi:flagellar protein FlaF
VGFSVSGSAAIVFIGLVVAAGVAVPAAVGSFESMASAHGEQTDRGVEALNTAIVIENATYNATDDELVVRLENTGSTTQSVNDTSVLVDGTIPPVGDVTTDVGGDPNAKLWLPGETLNATVGNAGDPRRVKIVTGNGISETAEVGG